MGEMTVRGSAKKEIKCDLVKYMFEFQAEGRTVPDALNNVSAELERFLTAAEERGIKSDSFKVESNSTRESHFNSKTVKTYIATRKISAVFAMDSAFLNSMLNFISENKFNVTTSESYLISNMEELHKELLKLAIEDSKSKAEMIASCAGTKITGMKSLSSNTNNYTSYKREMGDELNDIIAILADNLSSPTSEESESVEIVWLME